MNPKFLAGALADAMLAGEPEPAAVQQRCAEALGRHRAWLPDLVRMMVSQYGVRWHVDQRDVMAQSIRGSPELIAASRQEPSLKIRRYFTPPSLMAGRPAAFAHCALPDLPNQSELARWLHLDSKELNWLAPLDPCLRSDHYVYRWIPKRHGERRLLEMPKARLRDIQRRILRGLLDQLPVHAAVHGFRKHHSICTHAQAHVGQRVVLRLDLKDFFLTLPGGHIRAVFQTLGYPPKVASQLLRLCTHRIPVNRLQALLTGDCEHDQPVMDWPLRKRYVDRHLPQGAPTSPALANLCAYRLDLRLCALAERFEAKYTRYADDLTFSGSTGLDRRLGYFIPRIGAIAMEEGLQINYRKTRVMRGSQRQEVTGVVINQKLNVRRDQYDRLKAILHNCIRHGPQRENRHAVPDFRAYLQGQVAHISLLNQSRGRRLHALLDRIIW